MSGELVAFIILSAGLLSSGAGVLIARNPIYSALSLIMSFFFLAGLYLQLNATFVAIIQILVYGGAIMVLFVFVIMLLNLSDKELGEQRWNLHKVVGVLSALLIAGVLFSAIAGAQKGYLSEPAVMRTAVLERLDAAGQRHFPSARQLVLDVNRLGELASSPVQDGKLLPGTQAEAAELLERFGRMPDASQGEGDDASGAATKPGLKPELPTAVSQRLSGVIAKAANGGSALTQGDLSNAYRALLEGVLSGDVDHRRASLMERIERISGVEEQGAEYARLLGEIAPLLRAHASGALEGLLADGLSVADVAVVEGLLRQEKRFWSGVSYYRDLTDLVSWGDVRMRSDKGTKAAGASACRISGRLLSRDLVELGGQMSERPALADLGAALRLEGRGAQVRWMQLADAAEKLHKRLPQAARHQSALSELRSLSAYPTLEASQQARAAVLLKENARVIQGQFTASSFRTGSTSEPLAALGAMVLRASDMDGAELARFAEAFQGTFNEELDSRARDQHRRVMERSMPRVPNEAQAFFEEPDAAAITPSGLSAVAQLMERAVAADVSLDAVEIEMIHALSAQVSPPESRMLVDLELPSVALERIGKEASTYADCLSVTDEDQRQLKRVASQHLRGYDKKLSALAAIVEDYRGRAAWRGHGAERLVPIELTREERAALEPVDAVYGARLERLVEEASQQMLSLDARTELSERVAMRLEERGNPATRYQMALMRLRALESEATGLGSTDSEKARAEAVMATFAARIQAVKSDYETVAASTLAAFREQGPSEEAMRYRPAVYDEDEYGTVETVGRDLFTNYLLPFEVTSVLLLAGILGAVVIARRRV